MRIVGASVRQFGFIAVLLFGISVSGFSAGIHDISTVMEAHTGFWGLDEPVQDRGIRRSSVRIYEMDQDGRIIKDHISSISEYNERGRIVYRYWNRLKYDGQLDIPSEKFWKYDNAGNLIEYKEALGAVERFRVSFTYKENRLISILNSSTNGSQSLFRLEYDSSGRLIKETQSDSDGDRKETYYHYTGARPDLVTLKEQFTFDAKTQDVDRLADALEYTKDGQISRIVYERHPFDSEPGTPNETFYSVRTYEYDSQGTLIFNRMESRDDSLNEYFSFEYDQSGLLIRESSLEYPCFSACWYGSVEYEYDSQNRVVLRREIDTEQRVTQVMLYRYDGNRTLQAEYRPVRSSSDLHVNMDEEMNSECLNQPFFYLSNVNETHYNESGQKTEMRTYSGINEWVREVVAVPDLTLFDEGLTVNPETLRSTYLYEYNVQGDLVYKRYIGYKDEVQETTIDYF